MRFRRRASLFAFSSLAVSAICAAHFAHAFSGKPKAPQASTEESQPSAQLAAAAGLPKWVKRDPDPKTEQWLSTINREGMMGLGFESDERQAWLKQRAEQFAEFAQTPASRRGAVAKCDAATDPFCTWMTDEDALAQLTGKTGRSGKHRGPRGNWRAVSKLLTSANMEKLKPLSERQLGFAIHKFQSFEPLEKVANIVIEKKSCDLAPLSLLLGTKAEEYLPDDYYRQKAIRLYELAANCGEGDVWTRASYRFSLLQIWGDHCDLALPQLAKLSQPSAGHEFRPRALFWTVTCSLQSNTPEAKVAAQQAKDALFANYPFSLHSLLLQRDQPERVRTLLSVPDTIARYRSQAKPELNMPVLAAESLIQAGELGVARRVLASINLQADGAEPEFQIYLAWLYDKVGDPISKFRTLTVAFRDHPASISRASLALYYPRNNEVNPDVFRAVGVNELVVMSLIRQESAFNERARSPAGALGLMQVMPRTARLMEHTRRNNLYDPNNNVRIGSKYFSFLLKRYDGDTELALAAYNAGPERVEAWVKRYNVTKRTLFLDLIPFRETREYVSSIARNYFWYSVLYAPPSMAVTPAAPSVTNAIMEKNAADKSLTAWEISPGIVSLFKTFGT